MEVFEDYVVYHEIFRLASQFIRYIEQCTDEQYNNLSRRKAIYIKQMCQDLCVESDVELEVWEKGEKLLAGLEIRLLVGIGKRLVGLAKKRL